MTASDKRVLLTRIIADAWEKVCETTDFEKIAIGTGCLMTVDGSGDDRIHPQGVEGPYTFDQNHCSDHFSGSDEDLSESDVELSVCSKSGSEDSDEDPDQSHPSNNFEFSRGALVVNNNRET